MLRCHIWLTIVVFFFFFSSRRRHTRCALVTGVQTCALPISSHGADHGSLFEAVVMPESLLLGSRIEDVEAYDGVGGVRVLAIASRRGRVEEIGRASCRERVCQYV